jgi:hypothetical protein
MQPEYLSPCPNELLLALTVNQINSVHTFIYYLFRYIRNVILINGKTNSHCEG